MLTFKTSILSCFKISDYLNIVPIVFIVLLQPFVLCCSEILLNVKSVLLVDPKHQTVPYLRLSTSNANSNLFAFSC